MTCSTCDPCENNCGQNCCNNACLRWGFDGCFLRGRCADGTELTPLDLCAWLKVHETCTELLLVPQTTDDVENSGYMLYRNECGEEYKFWVCDFLGLGSIQCLKDVFNYGEAQPCDLFVFDPDCDGDETNPKHGKWVPYHIPDAGDCLLEPDDNGYFKVLKKNDCGCIEECNLFASSKTWEYSLRDSWPDDPDWPFTAGSFEEVIDLKLDEKISMFGATDLEVTIQYGYGIQHMGAVSSPMLLSEYHNFQSVCVPVEDATPTNTPVAYGTVPLSTLDKYSKAITVQGSNLCPWGTWEWQVSRTVIVPKGKKLFLVHQVKELDYNNNQIPLGATSSNPGVDCSRLHALHVFVRATKGETL